MAYIIRGFGAATGLNPLTAWAQHQTALAPVQQPAVQPPAVQHPLDPGYSRDPEEVACVQQGGSWDAATSICHTMASSGPSESCIVQGGTWDPTTSRCLAPTAPVVTPSSGSTSLMDFVRAHPLGVGVAAVALLYLLLRQKPSQVAAPAPTMTPNGSRRRRHYRGNFRATSKFRIRAKVRHPGRIVRHRGRRLGHGIPPARYRRTGATKPQHYGWPQGYMYPIHDAKHVRLAASRFARFGRRYPARMRATIRHRIDQAKRHFGIGPYRVR